MEILHKLDLRGKRQLLILKYTEVFQSHSKNYELPARKKRAANRNSTNDRYTIFLSQINKPDSDGIQCCLSFTCSVDIVERLALHWNLKWKWKWSCSSCPVICVTMNCSLRGSSVHGVFQARVLEWVAIPFSRGSSQLRDRTQVSCIADRRFTLWATRKFFIIACQPGCPAQDGEPSALHSSLWAVGRISPPAPLPSQRSLRSSYSNSWCLSGLTADLTSQSVCWV